MTALSQTLEEVRKRLGLYQGKPMNEQNTKTALIDPVLRSLGWEVGNLEEVSQEYRRRPKDKPVDYALFLLRTPKLFLEAKSLGQTLDDRKWANQIMGYAAVAGVKWVVLTNGDEYRIYNSCVEVPIEEKLFRSIRVSAGGPDVGETLALLSKDRIRDNEIQVLWDAHFVDRQVRTALEGLFSPEPDSALMRLLRKRVPELSPKDVRASLARLRVRFDFPVEPEMPSIAATLRQRKQRVVAGATRTKAKAFVGVSLKQLIDAGMLKPPLKLTVHYKKADLDAELLSDGTVNFQGKNYKTCSTAAEWARGTITGRTMNTNGWTFWNFRADDGKLRLLDSVRQEYLKRTQR